MSDLIERTLDLYTEQFCESENLIAFTRAILRSLEKHEFTVNDLLTKRWLSTSEGVQLDRLGELLGIDREGRDDESYRAALRFQVFLNISKGTPEDLIVATRVTTNASFVRYWENYPAGVQIFTNGDRVLDVSGAEPQDFRFVFENGDPFIFEDGSEFQIDYQLVQNKQAWKLLEELRPVGINQISYTFSLGKEPLFGFGLTQQEEFQFVFENGDPFVFENGDPFLIQSGLTASFTDGYQGFSELVAFQAPLAIESEQPPLDTFLMQQAVFDDAPLAIESEQPPLDTFIFENGDPFIFEDGSEFGFNTLGSQPVNGVLQLDDNGLFNTQIQVIEEFDFVFEDGAQFGFNTLGSQPVNGLLQLDDNGLFQTNFLTPIEFTRTPFAIESEQPPLDTLLVQKSELIDFQFVFENGDPFIFENGDPFLIQNNEIVDYDFVFEDGAQFGLNTLGSQPVNGVLQLNDNGLFILRTYDTFTPVPQNGGFFAEGIRDDF